MLFWQGAIIILLVNYCAFLFSQKPIYTKEFDFVKGNVPLQILNTNPNYFFVLRYNKPVHDFTLERRSKSDGKVLSFTPLKLDSLNASWFDYEALDYQLLELRNTVYFVFEKVTNTKRAIYVKAIDTLGKSSGFKELGTLDLDSKVLDFKFSVKITAQNKLLIVGEQYYNNYTVKKVALLYDLEKSENIWVKKLPLENKYSGFSSAYECNAVGDLYYTLSQASVWRYKRKFQNHQQMEVPELIYNSIQLVCLPRDSKSIYKLNVLLRDSVGQKSFMLFPGDSGISVFMHGYKLNETEEGEVFYLTKKFNNNLSREIYFLQQGLSEDLKSKLTFYDASDYNSPADKDHTNAEKHTDGEYAYILAGREEENYYKELVFLKTSLTTGSIVSQQVLPRKLFYFNDRTRFKNIGVVATALLNNNFFAFLIEDEDNLRQKPAEFKFHQFARQKYLWGAYLAVYILRPDNSFEKKAIHHNTRIDFVPLKYSGNQADFVFYLNRGNREGFAILNLLQL